MKHIQTFEFVNEGINKSALKKQIKIIDKQIDDETGGDGEPLTDETLQALETERERLEKLLGESLNEGVIGIKTEGGFKPKDLSDALDKAKVKYKMNRLSTTLTVLNLDKNYFEDAKKIVDDLGLNIMMAKESVNEASQPPTDATIKPHMSQYSVSDDPYDVAEELGKEYGWSQAQIEKAEKLIRKKYIKESLNEDYMKDLKKLDKGDVVIELDSGREWTIKKLRWWLGSPQMTLVDNTPGKKQIMEFPGPDDRDPNFFKYFKLKESVNEVLSKRDTKLALDNLEKWLPNKSPGPHYYYDIIDDGDVEEMEDLIYHYADDEVLKDYNIDVFNKKDVKQFADYIIKNASESVNEGKYYPSTEIGSIESQKDIDKFDNDKFIKKMYKEGRIRVDQLDTSYRDQWDLYIL